MMVDWPFGEPQPINNFVYRAELARLLRQRAKGKKPYLRLAEKIHGRYLADKDLMPGVRALLDIAITVNDIKVATVGLKAPVHPANFLVHLVIGLFLREAEVTRSDFKRLQSLFQKLKAAGSDDAWFWPKVEIIANLCEGIVDTKAYAERTSASVSPLVEQALTALPNLDQDIRNVMAELMAIRKYGVKSCYFQDGILHQPGEAWVFVDFQELAVRVHSFYRSHEDYVAAIVLTERARIQRLNINAQKIEVGTNNLLSLSFDFNGMSWAIDQKGELDISGSISLLSVRDIFRKAGHEPLYELVRLMQVLRLYDLVVPVKVVKKMPPLPQQKKGLPRLLDKMRPRRLRAPELMLPRLRELEVIAKIISGLERECDEADKETVERADREMRRHEVVNHIRQLPVGHHPSAKARERARLELGIELRDNETYVRRHVRGKGHDVGPHKARRR